MGSARRVRQCVGTFLDVLQFVCYIDRLNNNECEVQKVGLASPNVVRAPNTRGRVRTARFSIAALPEMTPAAGHSRGIDACVARIIYEGSQCSATPTKSGASSHRLQSEAAHAAKSVNGGHDGQARRVKTREQTQEARQ